MNNISKIYRPEVFNFCCLIVKSLQTFLNQFGYNAIQDQLSKFNKLNLHLNGKRQGVDFCENEGMQVTCLGFDQYLSFFFNVYTRQEYIY